MSSFPSLASSLEMQFVYMNGSFSTTYYVVAVAQGVVVGRHWVKVAKFGEDKVQD